MSRKHQLYLLMGETVCTHTEKQNCCRPFVKINYIIGICLLGKEERRGGERERKEGRKAGWKEEKNK